MNDKEKEALAGFILILVISLIIIWIKIQLAIIQFNRFLFWFDLIAIPLSLIGFLICLYLAWDDEWDELSYIIGIVVCLVFLFFSILTISGAYNGGYSDQAIQKEAQLKSQLKSYQEIQSILTGEKIIEIQNEVLEETINSLCQNTPNYPCEQTKQDLIIYKKIVGWKSSADTFAKILGVIKR